MKPGFGLEVDHEMQYFMARMVTHSMVERLSRIKSSASARGISRLYIRYAATIEALRPARKLSVCKYLKWTHILTPAKQCTNTPLPLSSSACINVIQVTRCLRMSSSSVSIKSIWSRLKVYFEYVIAIDTRKEYCNSRTSLTLTVPRIAVRMLWIFLCFRPSMSSASRTLPSQRLGVVSHILPSSLELSDMIVASDGVVVARAKAAWQVEFEAP